MNGPSDASVRQPVVAGRFYPGDPGQCREEAASYTVADSAIAARQRWLGALVPHAGWICSGAIAGQAIATLGSQGPVDVVIIFGAVHTPLDIRWGALDSHRSWALPTDQSEVELKLSERLLQKGNLFAVDGRMHAREHSIEVNVPMVQLAFPGVPILPIEVPPLDVAELIGRKTAQVVAEAGVQAAFLASSDLTHYGTNYGFAPAGLGEAGMRWTKDNDQRLLELIQKLDAARVVPEVHQHHNSCGAGAIAALLAACRQMGASGTHLLRHATSYETLASVAPQPPDNAVGYAGVLVG